MNLDLHLPIDLQESALSNYRNRHNIDNISRVTQDIGKMNFVCLECAFRWLENIDIED